jgi:hypothetical protein
MTQVSQDSTPPDKGVTERSLDKDEIDFTIGSSGARKPLDQESRMLQMVDTLIRSQTKKFELPVLGVLDLSESDHESSDDDDEGDGRDSMDFDDTTGEDFDDDDDWDDGDEDMVTSAQEQSGGFAGSGAGEVKDTVVMKAASDQAGRKGG